MGISEREILIKLTPGPSPEYSGEGSLRNQNMSKSEKTD
jgi:hypothetical protein